jgi:hypothetical protein
MALGDYSPTIAALDRRSNALTPACYNAKHQPSGETAQRP